MFFYIFLDTESILPKIGQKRIIVNGISVKCNSLRLNTFKVHGTSCILCGRRGTHFRIQSFNKNSNKYHLGLWSEDNVQLTKDHIIPKSYGGKDSLKNMQTMCSICNLKKSSSFSINDFNKGDGTISYFSARIKEKFNK